VVFGDFPSASVWLGDVVIIGAGIYAARLDD